MLSITYYPFEIVYICKDGGFGL